MAGRKPNIMKPIISVDGFVTRNSSFSQTKDGKDIAHFSVSSYFKDSKGEKITNYFNVTAVGTLATIVKERLESGANYAHVRGEFSLDKYVTKEGLEATSPSIFASFVKMHKDEVLEDKKPQQHNQRYGNKQAYSR
jgi:single-stranded DNA-binding protein